MTRSTPRRSLAAVLTLALAAVPATSQLVLATDQPAYEVNQLVTLTIDGPPGTPVFLLVDLDPGPVTVPGLGTFELGFSPLFFYLSLGPVPASGRITVQEPFMCRTADTYGNEFYAQAVGIVDGQKVLSNPHHFAHMPGDCDGVCDPPVVELGFQTTFEDALAQGVLYVEAHKAVGQQDVFGELILTVDLTTQATGVVDPPITNGSGSIVVPWMEWQDGDLTLRFFIDTTQSTGAFTGPEAVITAGYGGEARTEQVHTSCSQPLDVGMTFGPFTLVKMADGD